jgi:ABC-type nickel/cobalt efflux system permease component RcnA
MKARVSDWLSFALAFAGSTIAILAVVGLLNLTGDCAPEVTNCGEPQRRASFVILGLGVVWLIYLVVRFIRSATRFHH